MRAYTPKKSNIAAELRQQAKVITDVEKNGENHEDFHWVETDEPHATRRRIILAKHPEIATLFGRDIRTFYLTVVLFTIQMAMMYAVSDASWLTVLILSYAISGTINGTQFLIAHDLAHNLCFESTIANQLLAIFSNLSTGFPAAMSFKKYHLEHHQYQGVDRVDMDIPSDVEVKLIGRSSAYKALWVLLQPALYPLRPLLARPTTMRSWEILNWVVQVTFNTIMWYHLGWKAAFYQAIGTMIGMGLHPCGGHFISEHYEFVRGNETYSYYGPMNYLQVNVGYHNEHHDFPRVPWTRLPLVRQMAPEFYENLPYHTSYVWVIWKFITSPELGTFSRIKRSQKYASNKKE